MVSTSQKDIGELIFAFKSGVSPNGGCLPMGGVCPGGCLPGGYLPGGSAQGVSATHPHPVHAGIQTPSPVHAGIHPPAQCRQGHPACGQNS